jgi:hypothetical protein
MKALCSSLVLAAAPLAASAHVHPPDIEARLAAVVGDWTIEGQEATYRERCEWYRNRAFVVCATEDKRDNAFSQSILGYSKARQRFTYHNYSASGSSRSEFGFPHGARGIVYTDERQTTAGLARVTVRLEPQPDGRLRFIEERSVDGRPWERTADFLYVPRKTPEQAGR